MLLQEKQTNGTLTYKDLSELKLGDKVCLKYKHPNELGFVNLENTFTRFKEDDLIDCIVEGKVHKIDETSSSSLGTLYWFKQNGTDRSFIFLENEMKWIERRL